MATEYNYYDILGGISIKENLKGQRKQPIGVLPSAFRLLIVLRHLTTWSIWFVAASKDKSPLMRLNCCLIAIMTQEIIQLIIVKNIEYYGINI